MNKLDKMCYRKRRFATKEAALAAAATRFIGFVLDAYRCRNCAQWHLFKSKQVTGVITGSRCKSGQAGAGSQTTPQDCSGQNIR